MVASDDDNIIKEKILVKRLNELLKRENLLAPKIEGCMD